MQLINATAARKEFFGMIREANEKHQTFQIHHRDGDAILMSSDEYESLVETLILLSTPAFKKSIQRSMKQSKNGDVYPMEDIFKDS